jgi:hypothetical protein
MGKIKLVEAFPPFSYYWLHDALKYMKWDSSSSFITGKTSDYKLFLYPEIPGCELH